MGREIWSPLKRFEKLYDISTSGRIRSTPKQYNSYKYKMLILPLDRKYLIARLHKNGKEYRYKVHRLMAFTFLKRIRGKRYVNHKNGNKLDNRLVNLEWCTFKENIIHAYRTGLHSKKGVRNENCKLTEQQVLEIFKSTDKRVELSNKFGISLSQVDCIKLGYSWGHLTKKKINRVRFELTEKIVMKIFKSGLSYDELAKKYNRKRSTVWRIKTGRSWGNITKYHYE